jgi:hypothetical protein
MSLSGVEDGNGEIEKQEQDAAILINGCPLVVHPGNKKVSTNGSQGMRTIVS